MYVNMILRRKQYHCETCGSSHVSFDAFAYWDYRRQKFVYDIFDNYCHDCGDLRAVRIETHENQKLKNVDIL